MTGLKQALAETAAVDGWRYLGGFANPITLGDES